MDYKKQKFSRRNFLALGAGIGIAASLKNKTAWAGAFPEQEEFSFAVIADPHCAEEPKNGMEHLGNGVDKLLRCFDVMKSLPADERPDFILIAGDIHSAALAPHLEKISLPVHAVAGNHEGNPEARGLLRKMFPDDFGVGENIRDYYSFVHKGVRFIGLCDAGTGGEHVGQFSSELITPFGQCDWFEQQLALPELRKVVFAHIPPVMDGGDRNMYMSRNDSRWFLETVTNTPPEMLFFGHLHQETETYPIGNAKAVNLRSCCWNFNKVAIGFMLVKVTREGMTSREIITGEYKG